MTTMVREPRKRLASQAVRVLSGAALSTDGARKVAPNGVEYDHKFVASTETLASDNGVILLSAWRLADWLQRPRWIANHNLWGDGAPLTEITLGRGVFAGIESGLDPGRVGPTGAALCAYVKYGSSGFAREVRALYEEGSLDDCSVRWNWATEELRAPTEAEVLQYGIDLAWICTRADLIEVSAVLLGADPGAQVVRQGVVEAFERVRSAGHRLPELERFIRAHQPRRVAMGRAAQEPDPTASASALDGATAAVTMLGDLHDAAAAPRQSLSDAVTALGNLVSVVDDEASNAPEALDLVSSALTAFDLTQRDQGAALTALREALGALAAALGLDGRAQSLDVDLDACLADRRGAATNVSTFDYYAAIFDAAAAEAEKKNKAKAAACFDDVVQVLWEKHEKAAP
jgi:hypothetical protein